MMVAGNVSIAVTGSADGPPVPALTDDATENAQITTSLQQAISSNPIPTWNVSAGSGLAKAIFDAWLPLADLPDPVAAGDTAGAKYDAQATKDGPLSGKPPGQQTRIAGFRVWVVDSASRGVAATNVKTVQAFAVIANAIATATVAHVQASAEVSLTGVHATVAAGTSLGTTPNPNNASTAIVGPGVDVPLVVTGTAGATKLSIK